MLDRGRCAPETKKLSFNITVNLLNSFLVQQQMVLRTNFWLCTQWSLLTGLRRQSGELRMEGNLGYSHARHVLCPISPPSMKISKIVHDYYFCFVGEATPHDAQSLFVALHSGTIPGGTWENIWDARCKRLTDCRPPKFFITNMSPDHHSGRVITLLALKEIWSNIATFLGWDDRFVVLKEIL